MTLPNRDWQLKLWASTLFNKRYYSFLQASSSGDQGTPAASRIYGVTLGWSLR